jgi:multiple sugar transport system substrate-binding protein/raffinose/stachyose/melibiose transport system substrate-binding protein
MKNFVLSVPFMLLGIAIACAVFLLRPEKGQKVGEEVASPADLSQQIRLYHYFSGPLSGGMTEMIASVNSGDTKEQVVAHALDHEAFKSMIHTTLAKDQPPELFTYWAGEKTQALVDQGKLEQIDDIWPSTPFADHAKTPVTEAASTYNNRKYLLPIAEHFIVFFYNKQLFAREGFSAPNTWTELLELAENLKSRGLIPFALGAKERWPAQFWFDYLLLRTAGPTYRQALMETRAKYTDPQVRTVYALWGTLLQKGYFNENANDLDWTEATDQLCSGEAAMTLMGTWVIPLLSGEKCGLAEESGFDFFVFPTMRDTIPKVALGPVDGIVLTKGSIGQQPAKAALRSFAKVAPQMHLSAGSGAFAPNSLVPKDFYSPLRQRIKKESSAASHWAFNYDLATPSAIADKGMDSFNEIIAFPDQGAAILTNLQHEVEKLSVRKLNR